MSALMTSNEVVLFTGVQEEDLKKSVRFSSTSLLTGIRG